MVEVILKMPGQPDSPLSIPPGQYQVGSSAAVPIQLPFVGVSKLHCVLQATESTLRIADLGSSNGTYLNGMELFSRKAELNNGDIVSAVNEEFVFYEIPLAKLKRAKTAKGVGSKNKILDGEPTTVDKPRKR